MSFKNSRFIYLLLFVGCIGYMTSCASSGSLGGGPKDVRPPKIDSIRSDKNFQTQVVKRSFKFYFDEYVQVKDVVKQVLISPPLVYIPKVKARAKVVEFLFNEKEELKENTTYIINFGEAISDFTESNKLKDFKFVFSTGMKIDSLEMKGKIFDENNKPVKDAIVMLHDVLNDSIIIRKKPYYYTKTNENGEYYFQNIKNDTFKIVAIKDENSNLIYDQLTESIGFIETNITWDTSNMLNQNLSISKAEVPFKIIGVKDDIYGKVAMKLATKPDDIPLFKILPKPNYHFTEIVGDSIILWYNDENIDSFEIQFETDTVNVKTPQDSKTIKKLTQSYNIVPIAHIPSDTISIVFSQPIESINDNFISVKDTHEMNMKYKVSMKDKSLKLIAPFVSKGHYNVTILPNAVKDNFGNTNDTISLDLICIDVEKLSAVNLDLLSLDSTQQYIVQFSKGNTIIKNDIIVNVSKAKFSYKNLKSDEYSITIVEDKNRNGRKDASNYWIKRYPEISKTIKLDKLRESWILDQEVDYKTMGTAVANNNEPTAPAQSNKTNPNNNRKPNTNK